MPLSPTSNSTSITSSKSPSVSVETDSHSIGTQVSTVTATYDTLVSLPPKSNLVKQLLKMFCVKWPKLGSQVDNNPSAWPSPWILPVHVMSNRQDKDRHQITKIAKCTIDTGNMQGNVISRDFVENVLEFPFESFEKLTGEEQKGGTGITGDLHTPLGAIHLSWYYSSSTRVFRNMRFLISQAPHYDMIIGAQSIQREKILSVPCLMADNNKKKDPTFVPEGRHDKMEELTIIHGLVEEELHDKKLKGKLPKSDPLMAKLKNELAVVKCIQDLHGVAPKTPDEDALWEKIKGNYPKISTNLSQILKRRLEELRHDLGHHGDIKNPWEEPAPPNDWSDGIDYAQRLNSSK